MTGGPVAILAWGSLVWDIDNLAPHVTGDWQMGAGPVLPMEFSRISPKRLMGLVLCLDPADGTPCVTHAIRSRRAAVAQAQADLAARERAPLSRIGWVDRAGGQSRVPGIVDLIGAWCTDAGWSGAVWTDLEPNFEAQTGRSFTYVEAETYLRGLEGASREEAERYIRNAPAQTDTGFRRHLAARDWWAASDKDKQG
ncbi:hypothetical protein [Oceanomicrobium pacificus]|uniref:Gamma-glutamylcyclotransferase n=1 Tax=Oceanomicrobium pacificus TaxID=2692916 RepID=A0A6B0TVD5_9RHOB|nr:hypothetical protein [Oceanomicrobium pacificus]MXU64933.1 hypothetical protein [Oceanomicrobium pacificus]